MRRWFIGWRRGHVTFLGLLCGASLVLAACAAPGAQEPGVRPPAGPPTAPRPAAPESAPGSSPGAPKQEPAAKPALPPKATGAPTGTAPAPGAGAELQQAFYEAGLESVADQLGTTVVELKADLRTKTLAQVGQAYGKSRDEVGKAFLNGVRGELDEAVSAGRVSRQDADGFIQSLERHMDTVLDRAWPQNLGAG